MALSEPREGNSLGFHIYPGISDEWTLGDPETIVWASIRQLCSLEFAEKAAADIHRVQRKKDRQDIAANIKVYIQQATEFYDAAHDAKPNTAPLIYYYSFLNLAKALCEFRCPRLHKQAESYHHGLSWRPDPKYIVNLEREEVTVTARGVWHLLWEILNNNRCRIANPAKLRIKELFSYCPEISTECERTFGGTPRLLYLEKPDILYDESLDEVWIRFSIDRDEFSDQRISAAELLSQIRTARSDYTEVKAPAKNFRTFQSTVPLRVGKKYVLEAINKDVLAFNAFTHLHRDTLEYSIPVQRRLPITMPQVMVLYTILFWLGSLVRYDPHSVYELMDSRYWILIDGFMSQSRLFLLELFEWAFYQTETTLGSR